MEGFQNPLIFLYWGLVAFALIEARLANHRSMLVYSKQETSVAIALGLGFIATTMTLNLWMAQALKVPLSQKIFSLPSGIGWGVLAFLVLDLSAYITHRLSHHLAFFWTDHAVHHAAKEMNLLTHMRHGWTSFISLGFLANCLFEFMGNMESILIIYFFVSFAIQSIAHSQLIGKLPGLDWFLVTPSNHRIHHSAQTEHINKNYGVVFIIWDKLFGSFVKEDTVPCSTFGIPGSPKKHAPIWEHALFAWRDLFQKWRLTKARIS